MSAMSFHIVICRAGETREYIREVEMHDATREAVIAGLIAGEYSEPLRVLLISEPARILNEFDSCICQCSDVSESIAMAILHRAGMHGDRSEFWSRRRELLGFCQTHAGIAATNETMQAAE